MEAPDAITREENPDRGYGSASKLPRPGQTHTTRRMLLWVHLPIQLHAAWPVPFRLAFHCPGLVRDIPEHWNQPNKREPPRTPRWPAVSLSIRPWGCTGGSSTGRRHQSHCKTDAYLTTTRQQQRIAPPRGWLCSLVHSAAHVALVRSCAMAVVEA